MELLSEVDSSETKDFVNTTHQDPKLAKLTLEMFMNNSYYTKYLSTSDPTAYKEHQGFLDSIVKHRYNILELTKNLLDHPEIQITVPVLETFKQYASSCIKYIELCELEKKTEAEADTGGCDREWSDAESNHDMLFENSTDDITEDDIIPFPKSFWGPAVQKHTREKKEDIGSGKTLWGDIRAFSNKR